MDEDQTEQEDQVLPDLLRGAWRALTARAMAELRLADALVEPGTAAEVSARIGADASALDRLLRTLAALGLVTFSDGRFGLTAAGHGLRSDVPGSDWGAIMMMAAPWTLATWQGLPETVRTGEPAFERVHGTSVWDYLRSHEEAGQIFNASMARASKDHEAVALTVAELKSLGARTVVDVGGGTGRLLAQVVARMPGLRGILADQEAATAESGEVFAAYEVGDRCEAAVCDFFEAVPTGGDVYLLSNILHDWDDGRCRDILRRIHEAAAPGARLMVLETVLPDDRDGISRDSASHRLLDLMMLLNFGARERTLAEYADLLESTGFGDVRLIGGETGRDMVVADVRDAPPA